MLDPGNSFCETPSGDLGIIIVGSLVILISFGISFFLEFSLCLIFLISYFFDKISVRPKNMSFVPLALFIDRSTKFVVDFFISQLVSMRTIVRTGRGFFSPSIVKYKGGWLDFL